jgi:hypothetical protein
MLAYFMFMAIWNCVLPFGIFHDHLVYFVVVWHILLLIYFLGNLAYFPRFGMFHQENLAALLRSRWKAGETLRTSKLSR